MTRYGIGEDLVIIEVHASELLSEEIVFRDERDGVERRKAYVEERGLGSGVHETHATKGGAFDGSTKDLRVWSRVDG